MSDSTHPGEKDLLFFASQPRPCSYLENRDAVSIFADPNTTLSQAIYDQLAMHGFRRSGKDLYAPSCPECNQCTPVRVVVPEFKRSRSLQRIWQRNQDLTLKVLAPVFQQEHYELYVRYLETRHPGGGMDNPEPDDYMKFLTSDWSHTKFLEFRLDGRVIAVAVTDYMHQALSAVYTFFDPDLKKRSLGSYAILRQIELARQMSLNWHYLGFWIADCGWMAYKKRFQPIQGFRDGRWQDLA